MSVLVWLGVIAPSIGWWWQGRETSKALDLLDRAVEAANEASRQRDEAVAALKEANRRG